MPATSAGMTIQSKIIPLLASRQTLSAHSRASGNPGFAKMTLSRRFGGDCCDQK
jgi:hypothetical protein